MDLKEYIEECDEHGHRYFTVDLDEPHFGICNNHVIPSEDRKKIVAELNAILKVVADGRFIDTIFKKNVV